MAAGVVSTFCGTLLPDSSSGKLQRSWWLCWARNNNNNVAVSVGRSMSREGRVGLRMRVRCSGGGIGDFIGGDLVKLDLGRWLADVEEHKALAIYTPHEGGYEGRYLTRLRYQGYYFLELSARGLGDPETTLTKIHPVCPAHLGKQPIARWYFPPEVDYRLSLLPPNAKGLVLWLIEAKVLSKSELQYLALLPTLRPKVRVIAECGNWRKFMWKPLKEIAGLTAHEATTQA
ncbi:NAD(P)H-quinone oxidoreductase subunit N, chloroplastic-like [Macadamia integrifolia]|uniref:NAD(P)H-quinone oxidoreductase subunit N, chloroplastic-like n=1 Tax=Macadamia integrifolia TaxID=60698 RepID=UPI001C4FD7A8|nr:NAD(P)H-quinone oxidoreductase subunit N, chloroplastic-like [Macadamia integrifolia]